MVAVATVGGQIERHTQSLLACRQVSTVKGVAFLGRREPGILSHRPRGVLRTSWSTAPQGMETRQAQTVHADAAHAELPCRASRPLAMRRCPKARGWAPPCGMVQGVETAIRRVAPTSPIRGACRSTRTTDGPGGHADLPTSIGGRGRRMRATLQRLRAFQIASKPARPPAWSTPPRHGCPSWRRHGRPNRLLPATRVGCFWPIATPWRVPRLGSQRRCAI